MKTTYITCVEHEHCQQEIRESQWDDKPNSYIVVHHRESDSQPSSPLAPEGRPARDRLRRVEDDLLEHRNHSIERIDDLEALVLNRKALRRARRAARKAE